ncbi:MAG: alkylation repair enzyme [Myxococcales bacterium]|nr:alkylation repair enzyme [Myxococcales bacterium]
MNAAVTFFKKRFKAEGDAASAVAQKAYMKSALHFHGVVSEQLRVACADFVKATPLDHDALVAAVDALYATNWFDLHSAGIGLLERKRKLLGPEDAAWLIGLVRRSGCWAHVDWIATKMVPHTLPAKPAKLLTSWARDDDFWVRRTALLAQLDLLRAGAGDFPLFARLATPMLGEKEFFIRKAIGWVLRDVARKRPELTFGYVKEHGEKMSGLTYREATRRLPEELQARL